MNTDSQQSSINDNSNLYYVDDYNKPTFETSYAGDAAKTLFVANVKITKNYISAISNIGIYLNSNEVGLLFPRSSISKYDWILANGVGVIDSNYHGLLEFRYKPLSIRTRLLMKLTFDKYIPRTVFGLYLKSKYLLFRERYILNKFPYIEGTKCGQLLIMDNKTVKEFKHPVNYRKHNAFARKSKGFGSSGI